MLCLPTQPPLQRFEAESDASQRRTLAWRTWDAARKHLRHRRPFPAPTLLMRPTQQLVPPRAWLDPQGAVSESAAEAAAAEGEWRGLVLRMLRRGGADPRKTYRASLVGDAEAKSGTMVIGKKV